MKLYIAEKRSAGRALADVLPGPKVKGGNCIRCGGDVVAWASGHLLELCEPEDYDERYKRWSRDTLLYVPKKWKRREIARTKGLLNGIRKLLNEADTVVNVGDSDREGQSLIDEILEYCGWAGPTKRLRINDMNPDAIRRALNDIRDNADYKGEYMAGQARLYADWLVGLAMTRYVTVELREAGYGVAAMSVGRVQTPTLGLVVARDREIEKFVSSSYYESKATLLFEDGRKIVGRWLPDDKYAAVMDERRRIVDREAADRLTRSIEGQRGEITTVTKKGYRITPPLPFSLSKLQMAASKQYDMTDTLVHVQKLYESGCVTYPRTGCDYIPEGHFPEAARVVEAIRVGSPALAGMLSGVDLTRKSPAWDTSKITEHHAIIPTTRVPGEGALSETERRVYKLICARYVMQFLGDFEYEETVVEFGANGERFRATGRTIVNAGWQAWEKEDDRDEEGDGERDEMQTLPEIRQGESGLMSPSVTKKTTTPPKSHTYHSLIAAMNNIHVYVKDPEIRAKLKEVQGIGTEATQENIIGVLFRRGYLAKKKRQVVSTELGRLLIDLLNVSRASVMVQPDMTALWERRMADIENGGASLESFIGEVADRVRGIVSERLEIPARIPALSGMARQQRTRAKCPSEGCGGSVVRFERKKDGRPFWKCDRCRNFFDDADGAPSQRNSGKGILKIS